MKRNYAGCAICDSTWGDVWEEVEGERLFFCCALCARQFRGLLDAIHRSTGWERIDSLTIEGDRRGRAVRAGSGGVERGFLVTFTSTGELLQFLDHPAR